jgi:Lecithin retinol acyltransferase
VSSMFGRPIGRGGDSDIHIPKRGRAASQPDAGDRFLVPGREPALGSHMVTPRRGYLHHGIYVGSGRIVHYSGFAHGLRGGPVEEVPLAHFTRGRPVWVKGSASASFDRREVVRRARSRIGEDLYRLFTNNCEHFCEWCLRGEPRSLQIEALLDLPKRALRAMNHSIATFVFNQPEILKWKTA